MERYYLSVEELAERLGVHISWIYARTRLRGPDAIPRVRLGKYVKFRWDEVEEWLQKQNEANA